MSEYFNGKGCSFGASHRRSIDSLDASFRSHSPDPEVQYGIGQVSDRALDPRSLSKTSCSTATLRSVSSSASVLSLWSCSTTVPHSTLCFFQLLVVDDTAALSLLTLSPCFILPLGRTARHPSVSHYAIHFQGLSYKVS